MCNLSSGEVCCIFVIQKGYCPRKSSHDFSLFVQSLWNWTLISGGKFVDVLKDS